jgi:hypothetical protein
MLRVDGNYLYTVGGQLHLLDTLKYSSDEWGKATTAYQALAMLFVAEGALEPLITRTVFQLRMCVQSGNALLQEIRNLKETLAQEPNKGRDLEFIEAYKVSQALKRFEAVLGAELALCPLYVVSPKAGYDTNVLIEVGAQCFPAELTSKAPEAVAHVQAGTKCIAFELFTAAGFHFHRANEAVLHRYWDAVTEGAERPKTRNMGDYLSELRNRGKGDDKVIASLTELKKLHRNPLVHEESIENLDEAVALMHGVHNAIVYMLKEIPVIAEDQSMLAGAGASPTSAQ